MTEPPAFLCFGHRGAAGSEPENTLRSVRRALELGAHGIEIDVRFVDGELIVFHDARLDRTTNGHGYVARKNFEHLRSLDAGRGERIPTLREVLETVDRRAIVNVELKGRATAQPVQKLIREYVSQHGWRHEQFLISSFLRRELGAITDPDIRIGLLLTRPSRLYAVSARHVRAWSIHPSLRFATSDLIEDAHRRGYRVFVYTVNAPHDIARMRASGADGIFTDYPERAAGEIVQKERQHPPVQTGVLRFLLPAFCFVLVGCATRQLPKYEKPLPRARVQSVRTTAYTHTEADHLQYSNRNALGEVLQSTSVKSAACDWSRWPVGTIFRIQETGDVHVVDDYGWALAGTNTVDLYRPSRASMNAWGVRRIHLEILRWGDVDRSLAILRPRAKYRHVARMVHGLQSRYAELKKPLNPTVVMISETAPSDAPPLVAETEPAPPVTVAVSPPPVATSATASNVVRGAAGVRLNPFASAGATRGER